MRMTQYVGHGPNIEVHDDMSPRERGLGVGEGEEASVPRRICITKQASADNQDFHHATCI